MMADTICESCGGCGKSIGLFPVWASRVPLENRRPAIELTCPTCQGAGWLTDEQRERIEAGKVLRRHRIDAGYGLRDAAEFLDVDPSELSRIEHGLAELEEMRALMERIY